MNPVNATTLYVSACRSVLQCDPRDPQALAELYKLLPFFRQSLSCLVCGNLLQDPIAPTNSSCQHYVCRACKGRKMLLKPSCSWCKDYAQFEENKQLCILVDCYRKLCEFIAESPLATHIADEVSGSPDVLAMLNEGLSMADSEQKEHQLSPTPSTSDLPEEAPVPEMQPLNVPGVNGLHDCNGLTSTEQLVDTVAMGSQAEGLKQESFGEELPVCVSVSEGAELPGGVPEGEELCAEGIDICSFGEDMKHTEGPLLLSVEEVLRTLEPDPGPEEDGPGLLQPGLCDAGSLNGPFSCSDSPRQPLPLSLDVPQVLVPHHPQPPSVLVPRGTRPNRKRSRSESDSERIQPLPISSILRGSQLGPPSPVAVKQEPKLPTVIPPHIATVPNGEGSPKVGKTLLVSSKGLKKLEHHGPKKAYAKAKPGAPRTKDKSRDRLPGNALSPGSPTKVYKKPQEKKGCKCGRATQNPSVLTCRGQRCPCYSNRKACLDCICRGCQNSYMANGEKKLEAFAVPEKALEQTRLTLGINVTSIAVRNAGTSTAGGLLNVTTATGSPVASFLPHEDKAFDKTLDMRFDC